MSAVDEIRAMRPVDKFQGHRSGLTEAEFRKRTGGSPIWHSVDLGDVFIEGVRKTGPILLEEHRRAQFPDFRGKSVLDIGAFGGWFSFEAERRGASEVVAIDYHSWAVDWPGLLKYMSDEKAAGRVPDPYAPPAHLIDEVKQPGRSVFDLTKEALGSIVEPVLSRVEDYNPGRQFDIVLYLGVLYHCEDPMASLKKVAALTRETIVVETLGISTATEDVALWQYFHDDSVNSDVTTWWAPNAKGLGDMLRAVGFLHVKVTCAPPLPAGAASPKLTRLWVQASR
jgi:tRNA (mo5U34)-methyltransferase